MENKPNEYDAGTDQNQGVVGTMARNQQQGNTEATQMPDLDPNLVTDGAGDSPEKTGAQPNTDTLSEQAFVSDEEVA